MQKKKKCFPVLFITAQTKNWKKCALSAKIYALNIINKCLPKEKREYLLKKLFFKTGENITVEQPFYCDYGKHISVGKNLFINHNCIILDCNNVTIGDNVFIAPNCGIYTAGHPLDFETRNKGLEYARPIKICSNVWIGANTAILPGVTIGEGTVIGAGSVVKTDIPPNVLAYGNPCKVIKKIIQK